MLTRRSQTLIVLMGLTWFYTVKQDWPPGSGRWQPLLIADFVVRPTRELHLLSGMI